MKQINERSEKYKNTLLEIESNLYSLYKDETDPDRIEAFHDAWYLITGYEIDALDVLLKDFIN